MLEGLSTAARQAASVSELDHRPWPIPKRPWIMGQTWDDLLFAHFRVRPQDVEPLLEGLRPDTFDGDAWVGVTPFVIRGLRLVGTPPVPGLSTFPELNVRTYVTVGGKPGIWFFSLDTSSRGAVAVARRFYRLPYFEARMSARRTGGQIEYESERKRGEAAFSGSYRGLGNPQPAEPGSLEHFLAERYCLYTVHRGSVCRAEIHHRPWPLERAEAEIRRNTMAPPGVELQGEPLLHFSARQDVVIWRLEPAD